MFRICITLPEPLTPLRYELAESWPQSMMAEQLLRGGYELGTWKTLPSLVKPGDTVVNVGAHVGVFACYLGRLVGPTGKVYAVEPSPLNFERLIHHRALNDLVHLSPVPVVMGARDEACQFYENADNDGGNALWNPAAHPFNAKTRALHHGSRAATMRTLDRMLTAMPKPPSLILIDTEGAEVEILKGATLTLTHHPTIIAEVNAFGLEQLGSSPAALRALLTQHGYTVEALWDTEPYVRPWDSKQDADKVWNLIARLDPSETP